MVPEGVGRGHRNHCTNCLTSLHVDQEPGDRFSDCGGLMDLIGVWVRKGGEWAVIHRCRGCGKLDSNRTAADPRIHRKAVCSADIIMEKTV